MSDGVASLMKSADETNQFISQMAKDSGINVNELLNEDGSRVFPRSQEEMENQFRTTLKRVYLTRIIKSYYLLDDFIAAGSRILGDPNYQHHLARKTRNGASFFGVPFSDTLLTRILTMRFEAELSLGRIMQQGRFGTCTLQDFERIYDAQMIQAYIFQHIYQCSNKYTMMFFIVATCLEFNKEKELRAEFPTDNIFDFASNPYKNLEVNSEEFFATLLSARFAVIPFLQNIG